MIAHTAAWSGNAAATSPAGRERPILLDGDGQGRVSERDLAVDSLAGPDHGVEGVSCAGQEVCQLPRQAGIGTPLVAVPEEGVPGY